MTSRARTPSPIEASPLATWRRLVPYIRPFRAHLAGGFVLMAANVGMDLLKPWPLKWIVDGVVLRRPENVGAVGTLAGGNPEVLLALACAAILLVAVVAGLGEYRAQLLLATAGQRAVAAVKRDLFAHMQRLSLDFHRRTKSGELLTRLVKDVGEIRNALTETALESVSESLLLVCMVAVLVAIDPYLAILSAAIFPPLAWCVWHYSGGIRAATRRQRDKESKSASIFAESLAAISLVQTYAREGQTTDRFDRESQKGMTADLAATRLRGRMNRWVEVIVAAGTGLVLFEGARRVLAGSLTPGDLIVFSAYLRAMYKPVRRIAANVLQISRATVGASRVVEILETAPLVTDRPGARPAPAFAGRVSFEHVGFAYEAGRAVLRDVCLEIAPGTVVAVIGRSGAGKSTLVGLIPRLYDATSGTVRVDGHDVRDLTLESLRAQVSIVAQEAVLFGTSIRENIAFGSPDADRERIEQAARDAGAHEFIARLPRGYNTVVGERGATLSGGERQRLSLARAFCRDAPILILDEPTTGLDLHAEAHLLSTVDRLVAGRTTFVIAHRLRTIASADLVVHVDGGTVRVGTHRDLLDTDPAFRSLVALERKGQLA